MTTYNMLVRKRDGARFKAGDIVMIAEQTHPFGKLEKEMHDIIPVDSSEFYDIWNLTEELKGDLSSAFPSGVKRFSQKRLSVSRLKVAVTLAPCRYRIDAAGKIWDKKYDQ